MDSWIETSERMINIWNMKKMKFILCWALLDKEGIESYKSQFCSYQQVIVEKMKKFSHATNRNDKGEPELRAPNSIIFALREKLFVNIYPTTLSRIINNNFVFDFEEMFKEAIFELQNFLRENPSHINHEIIFTVPVNKGNYQWVEVTIEIHQNRKAIAYVNDPMGGGGINSECYKEFREIMDKNLLGKKLAEGETKSISSLSFEQISPHPKIQRDRYSGGAVRRMRDGIITLKHWAESIYKNFIMSM